MAKLSESNLLEIDVSETLKGLKAVTREAKKAISALKEFEEMREGDSDDK